MGFLSKMFPSFEDQVAKISDPGELTRLWENKKNEKKSQDQAVIEARLAEILADVDDLKTFERLFVLVDKRIGNWMEQVKEALFADDDQHILALGEGGPFLQHLVALCETPNMFRALLAESVIKKMADVRPDLVTDAMKKGIYDTGADSTKLLDVIQGRLVEILVEQIGRIDDVDVLSGVFDLATIGEGTTEFRIMATRERVVDRICEYIDQVDDLAWFKDLNVPKHPRIVEAGDTRMKKLLS